MIVRIRGWKGKGDIKMYELARSHCMLLVCYDFVDC